LAWSAPEFEYWQKPRIWYLVLILVSLVIFIIALWQGNFLFAVFVVLASIVLISSGKRPPRHLDFRLTEEALIIDNKKAYLYEQLSGFAIHRLDSIKDGLSELVIQRKHRLGAYLKILYPTAHTEEIRHFLNRHLPEIEYQDSLSDHFFRWLKF